MRVLSGVIIGLGMLLLAGGAYALITGAPYVQLEFGWAKVIAGTTALSAGVVTMALGAIHHRLGALARDSRLGMPTDTQARPPGTEIRDLPAAQRPPAPVLPAAVEEPQVDRSDGDAGLDGTGAATLGARALESPQPPRPAERDSRGSAALAPIRIHDEPPPPVAEDEPPESDMNGVQPPTPERHDIAAEEGSSPFHRVGIEDTAERTIVGRYESAGSLYVLFSDGTIEVTTSAGARRHFASMDDLRVYVERQEAERDTVAS